MLIHGALSDLLSVQGVKDMVTRRPDIDLVTVADQGRAAHAAGPRWTVSSRSRAV
jgi:hypothetical protein